MKARIKTPLGRVLQEEGRKLTWLAEQIGASKQEVWRWVHGLYTPAPATREAIGHALGHTVEDLFPDADSSEREAA